MYKITQKETRKNWLGFNKTRQYHTVKNWVKFAEKNPLHYIGVSSSKGVNLERLYFYYLNSDNAHRLRKHI